MHALRIICYMIAAISFALAAIVADRREGHRVNLVALGLLAWVIVPLAEALD